MQIGGVLSTLVFVVVGLAIAGFGAYLIYSESQITGAWDKSGATVTYSNLSVDRDSDGTTYQPDIEYAYHAGGKEYTGHCCGLGTGNAGEMQKIVDKNAKGRVVDVYVNPEDPYESRLADDVKPFNVLHLALAGFGALFALIGLAGMVSAMRQ